MSDPQTTQVDPRIALKLPDDLREGLTEAAAIIGIPRNATLILAARKGLASILSEYQQQQQTASEVQATAA